MLTNLNPILYVVCVLTDFAAFVVVFTVSRSMAEAGAEPWYLGVVGAGLSLSAGAGSLLGGWLAHRFDARAVFLSGAVAGALSIGMCWIVDPGSYWFLAGYWLMGIGLGFVYPPLIGWLNQGHDAHANRHAVSSTLIKFCVAWNVGMMCGQLVAGSLFSRGVNLAYGTAFCAALATLIFALVAATRVRPLVAPPSADPDDQSHPRELAAAFKRLSWMANLGGMFGGSLVIHLLPGLAVAIGVPAENHGELLASWRAVIIATYLVMHHVTIWHYRLSTALSSQALAACGLVVIANAESSMTLLIGLALLGQLVGFNYFSGLYYSAAGSSSDGRALAAGIHEATLAAGIAMGTIVGGLLGSFVNQRVHYLMAATVSVILMIIQATAWSVAVRRIGPGESGNQPE